MTDHNADAICCPPRCARRLSFDSRRIFNQVLAVMHTADEYDATESEAYVQLMQAIVDEASFRLDSCRRTFAETDR